MPDHPLVAACRNCGTEHALCPGPSLPASGGAISIQGDVVLEFVCGACWEKRPRTWKCSHCGGAGPIDWNFCSTCHHVRPNPLPYVPDWDMIWKEERERQREHDVLVAEWDRECPGWWREMLASRRAP